LPDGEDKIPEVGTEEETAESELTAFRYGVEQLLKIKQSL
jgi:hypothetical protein